MVLSDDGDTLSVAAGDIGGQTTMPTTIGQTNQQQQQPSFNFVDPSSMPRHPAYHTHSLDRHSHLRIFSNSQSSKLPPPRPSQQQFANIGQNPIRFGRPPPQRKFPSHLQSATDSTQLGSLLISPRHFGIQSTFAPSPSAGILRENDGRHSSASAATLPQNGQSKKGKLMHLVLDWHSLSLLLFSLSFFPKMLLFNHLQKF